MRRLVPLLLSLLFIPVLHAENAAQPVRLCVAMLQNSSREIVSPAWQQKELVKAFERINKSKEVKKGKAARVEPVALESTTSPDLNIREKNCEFVLRTNLTEVLHTGAR